MKLRGETSDCVLSTVLMMKQDEEGESRKEGEGKGGGESYMIKAKALITKKASHRKAREKGGSWERGKREGERGEEGQLSLGSRGW